MFDSADSSAGLPPVHRERRAVVVVDVVDSVRLMRGQETAFIELWRRFVPQVVERVLPPLGGRLVKSLGDGLLLDFQAVPDAVAASRRLHALMAGLAAPGAGGPVVQLRCGVHVGEVVVDALDIYGRDVNLAARLGGLALPGQTVVSAEVCDELVPAIDGDVEDLGDCFVKGLDEPVRAYRVGAPRPAVAAAPAPRPAAPDQDLRALVAVLPFEVRAIAGFTGDDSLGDWVAEGTLLRLSRCATLRVVSRMSTSALRLRRLPLPEIAALLGADYVLSGSCVPDGRGLALMAELSDGRSGEVVWVERLAGDVADILHADSEALAALASGVQNAVLATELQRASLQAPPNLRSYSLLLGAIHMMHRSARDDFERAAQQLRHLIERHPRLAAPRAWLAQWYVLRVTRGMVEDPAAEAALALDQVHRALDADPTCSFALTMRGFVECHMLRDLERAWGTLDVSTSLNGSDSLAWLFKGVVHSLWGQGEPALQAVREASRLSPLDPQRHYYDALSAPAALAAADYALAVEFAQRSLRANRFHAPTWRALAIAQAELGQLPQAQASVRVLLELDPGLTVRSYLSRSPAGANDTRKRYAEALRRAGLPP